MASAASVWEDEDWELCNDDGFVYKRKKRRQDLSTAPPPPPPVTDPEAEQRQLKERKKRALLKLKDEYQREIDQWETMSRKLQAMENRAHPQPPPLPPPPSSSMESARQSESAFRQLIDDLILQAEAQEAVLQDFSNMCDTAESFCKVEEERLKQSFIDLPIWETPNGLMTSLCDADD